MKKLVISVLLLSQLLHGNCSSATEKVSLPSAVQKEDEGNAGPEVLKVTINLTGINTPAKGQSAATFTLTNISPEALPATGWKLYFNGGRLRSTNSKMASIKHQNGDLHYLSPGPDFTSLKAGESIRLEVSGGAVKNLTDFPSGFYLVFDKEPDTGIPVALDIKTNNLYRGSDQALAARIYDQNAKIKDIPSEKLIKIFPTPVDYSEKQGAFTLNSSVVIGAESQFQKEAEYLAEKLAAITGKRPAMQSQAATAAITFKKNAAIVAEGYELSVNPNQIIITASSPAGAFYGVQSLLTLLPPTAFAAKTQSVLVPAVAVKDAPRFGYRGFMLDIARNFQPKAEVLKVLDLMALYKMNVFHFHFSEDEGWRLEIPSLPELTTVGATRVHSTNPQKGISPSYGSGPLASSATGTGYYSKEDFIEILKYAKDRHIRVIPEIESPGHARAAIKAMEARYYRLMEAGKEKEARQYLLRDLSDKSVYQSVQGWNDNVMDVSLPSTYAFLEKVVDEVRQMYQEAGAPLTTIHFGGDEVPAGVWEKSPAVQALISKNPQVKTTDDLWYYYFGKINQMLKTRNLFLSGWEEIGLKKVKQNGNVQWVSNPAFAAENFHVNVWKNSPGSGAEDLAYRMANAGYKVILTGVTHLYLDLAYNTSSTEPGQYWGGYVDVDKPFYFIPFDYLRNLKENDQGGPINPAIIKSKEKLTAKGKANIVGLEAPLWSETNRSPEQLEYKLLPKLLGVAERAWAKDPQWAQEVNAAKSETLYNQAWSEFTNTISKRELPRLDTYAGGFQYRVPTPGVKIISGKVAANIQLPGHIIRYTTNGSEPDGNSPAYTGLIATKGTIKLKAFNAAGRAGQTVTIDNK